MNDLIQVRRVIRIPEDGKLRRLLVAGREPEGNRILYADQEPDFMGIPYEGRVEISSLYSMDLTNVDYRF